MTGPGPSENRPAGPGTGQGYERPRARPDSIDRSGRSGPGQVPGLTRYRAGPDSEPVRIPGRYGYQTGPDTGPGRVPSQTRYLAGPSRHADRAERLGASAAQRGSEQRPQRSGTARGSIGGSLRRAAPTRAARRGGRRSDPNPGPPLS